jgi:hypothetical protein
MRKVLAAVLLATLMCAGCSTGWVAEVNAILGAAAPALINILQIVAVANGQPLNGNLAAKINADAGAIKTLAGAFGTASADAAPGVCRQLEAAVATYQADQQLVLQVAQVRDANTQTKITLLVGLVAGTAQAIAAAIPACQNSVTGDRLAGAEFSASGFADGYNRILREPTGNQAVDALTPKLALHRHSKLLRSVTFGKLQ